MLFGALISATDPVAVIALFKEVKAPARLSTLMDAESLFNDATAIVIFGIVLSVIQTGAVITAGAVFSSVVEFLRVFLGGIVVGATMGFAMLFSAVVVKGDALCTYRPDHGSGFLPVLLWRIMCFIPLVLCRP